MKGNYQTYNSMRSINRHLQRLENIQNIDNDRFIKNSKTILKLINENNYIIEKHRVKYKYDFPQETYLGYWKNRVLEYCEFYKTPINQLMHSRKAIYSNQRTAWYIYLNEKRVKLVDIGALFMKTHSTINIQMKLIDMDYVPEVKECYNKIKGLNND